MRDNTVTPSGTNKDRNTGVEFNASRSNPIYGNSDTVTPESLTTFMLIKY